MYQLESSATRASVQSATTQTPRSLIAEKDTLVIAIVDTLASSLRQMIDIELLVYTAITTLAVLALPIIVLVPAVAWILFSGLYLKK